MKKILLIAFGMTLVSGVVFADSHLSLRVAKTARTQKERTHSESMKAVSKTPVKPLRAVPAPERIVMSADVAVHNEMKLIKYELDISNGGNVDHDVVTYTYDEYGFPKVVSGLNFQTTFTYEWKEPGKVWSKRTVETENAGGKTLSVKSREFHSNGMVSKETDELNGRVLEFDENGYLTKSVDSEGYGVTYLYFAPADRWYQGYIYPDRIEEYMVDGNGVLFCRKEKIEGEWQTIQRRGEYYDKDGIMCGNMEEYYMQDGASFTLQTITVNEDRKVIKNNIRSTEFENITITDNSWEYDNDDRVVRLTRSREYQQAGNIVGMTSEIYRYFYGEIPVVGSGIEEVATDAGKEVKAVYRLDGVKAEADALTPGIYVVTYSDGSVRKITIK